MALLSGPLLQWPCRLLHTQRAQRELICPLLTFPPPRYEHCALTGSDGLALVLRGGDAVAALGRGGGSLGYGGLRSSLAIEFDSWLNPDMGDVYYNHVSVQVVMPLPLSHLSRLISSPLSSHFSSHLSSHLPSHLFSHRSSHRSSHLLSRCRRAATAPPSARTPSRR